MSEREQTQPLRRPSWKEEVDAVAELHAADDALTKMMAGIESRTLTQRQYDAVLELLEADRRATWFWTTSRTWATWITGVLVALAMSWDWVKKIAKAVLL